MSNLMIYDIFLKIQYASHSNRHVSLWFTFKMLIISWYNRYILWYDRIQHTITIWDFIYRYSSKLGHFSCICLLSWLYQLFSQDNLSPKSAPQIENKECGYWIEKKDRDYVFTMFSCCLLDFVLSMFFDVFILLFWYGA